MSVLICGMKIPKNCSTCPCFQYDMFDDDIDGYCKTLKVKITDSDEHHPNCPLVEIPSHGDLVDKDKLMQEVMDSDLDHLQRDDWKEVIQIVSDADVVIEAEGETK